jgi:hypothetical protein
MAASNRTIVLRGKDKGHHDEGILDTVASPGMHIQRAADDHFDKSPATSAELVKSGLRIVKEDDYQGKTVADDYAIGDVVFFYIPVRGDVINVLVKSGENLLIGDKVALEGGGTGLFIEGAGTEAQYMLESKETTGALGANTLVACEVLN